MIRDRIRSGASRVKRGLARRLFDRPSPDTVVSAPLRTSPLAPPAEPRPPVEEVEPIEEPDAPQADDVVGPPMTLESVAALFEDMVRPALQSDGGDIELLRVENDDVYVRLVGACSSCPSSTITMKMGIQRLLEEEFPQFRNLVQVPGPT